MDCSDTFPGSSLQVIVGVYNQWNAGRWRVSLSEMHERAGHARSSCVLMTVIRM